MSYAFFDVDDTLIRVKSMFDFFPFWCDLQGAPETLNRFNSAFERAFAERCPREDLNRLYYRFFAGESEAQLLAVGRRWVNRRFGAQGFPETMIFPEVLARLCAHRAVGVTPVFVSGSFPALLAPLAQRMGAEHILCTRQEIAPDGTLTGEILKPQTIGTGKADAIAAFLQQYDTDPRNCFAYGDDMSDRSMLEAVGHPVAVIGSPDLADLAQTRGWERLTTIAPKPAFAGENVKS